MNSEPCSPLGLDLKLMKRALKWPPNSLLPFDKLFPITDIDSKLASHIIDSEPITLTKQEHYVTNQLS